VKDDIAKLATSSFVLIYPIFLQASTNKLELEVISSVEASYNT